MPMERVRRNEAVSKAEFHRRLREWLQDTRDTMIGGGAMDGRTAWIYVNDDGVLYKLHADTRREAVLNYIALVAEFGDELAWEVAPNNGGTEMPLYMAPKSIERFRFICMPTNQ